MRLLFVAVFLCRALSVTPSLAQTNAPAANSPSSHKTETSCNTASSSTTTGNPDKTAGTSTSMETNAILPLAERHANSAAPTVQSDDKPMEARPDCPPETKK